jgi:outer membrane protein
MRANTAVVCLGLAAILALATGADDEPIRIGVVDLDQALNSTDEGKRAREEMDRKKREAESKVQPMLDRYQQMQEELKSKRFVLSEDALFQKQLDLAELQNQIQTKLKELEGQLKVDQTRIEGPLLTKMNEIVQGIGRDGGFTLILERSAPGVMYSREALDVTPQVIQKFNEKG